MKEQPSNANNARPVFSLKTLLGVTAALALIFGIQQWMGAPSGTFVGVPLFCCLPILVMQPKTLVGGAVGFVGLFSFCQLPLVMLQRLPTANWSWGVVAVAFFGFGIGVAVHGMFRGFRFSGFLVMAAMFVALLVVTRFYV